MKKIFVILLLCGGLALTACAPQSSPPTGTPNAAAEGLIAARQQIGAHLRAGRYQDALEVIDRVRRRSDSPESLVEEQLQILSALSGAAERRFEAGEFEESGRHWLLLLNHYPREQTIARRLRISRPALQDRLELCAEGLMAQGMVQYRAGNLPAAIASWKKILSFHPSHAGAKKGIQTAEIQLQNLRALP